MLTRTQAQAAQAIVNIFETGSVRGDYGKVTVIKGDTGHLSFGRAQVTLGSGGLHKVVETYCQRPGAVLAQDLRAYLAGLEQRDLALDHDSHLKNLLRASADDPVMRDTQDEFFESQYWQPAERSAANLGLSAPLSVALVYDSRVHGSWPAMRRRTVDSVGTPEQAGEEAWVRDYTRQRKSWLANHARADLRATVYRMEAFESLIEHGHWNLELPLVVRGVEVNEDSLHRLPPGTFDGPGPRSRTLMLQSPLMRGLDVRLVQLALSGRDYPVVADGIYGKNSRSIISRFQQDQGLPQTGAVDVRMFNALGVRTT